FITERERQDGHDILQSVQADVSQKPPTVGSDWLEGVDPAVTSCKVQPHATSIKAHVCSDIDEYSALRDGSPSKRKYVVFVDSGPPGLALLGNPDIYEHEMAFPHSDLPDDVAASGPDPA